jgi:DNA-binding SARP family transcriptional activator/type II secretory pathway predicted ATPase ExeA/tetratricopeptide (TPR) repeat protein
MPPRFFLRCLGNPELRGPGGEPIRFRTRKHLALLTFLAVERRHSHRRDRLADLLWPDARPAEGRHSLATALSVIRGKLGLRAFESSRDHVRLLAPDLEVDLDRLARGEILGDETRPPLEVAGFLEEFEVSRAPEFMLWRDLARAKWFPQIRDALILLMDRCRRTGDFARNGAHADRLLAIDELSEEAVRSKMEACAFQGDRISAIRIYQAWRQRLREELDAEPSPLVEGMALRLRQRSYEPPGMAHVPTVPTDLWRNRAFIGRAAQYRMLYERWEETNASRGRHALVLGDSGIGKTTLVQRLSTAAGLEGAVSSRVQCYDVERESPYSAIGTIVRGLLDRPGASGTPPDWLAELARCTPAVGLRFPNLPPARESAGESARLRLTEAVHELASAVADEHPVILVVDDVHLADDASVAVLHLLMRRTQEQRIMIIMTARQAELGNSPHAGRLMENRESLGLEAVELPPLTGEEMSEVIAALAGTAGSSMPPAVRRALLRASAGVPLIGELLFDDWRAHGEESLALSIGAMTVDAQGQEQRELYHRIFERTFRSLSAPARAVLNLAAILGERLNHLAMYELVDLSLPQTLAGMLELEQHRLLRDGGREMEFRNEMLRGYAYLSVPSPLRRALHGLIADRLLAAEATGDHIPGLTLAWHCFRAGRPLQAEPYLLRGSREALRKGGTFEVELALTSAMKGLTADSSDEARLLLAEALQEQNRHAEALALVDGNRGRDGRFERRREILSLRSKAELAMSHEEASSVLDSLEALLAQASTPSERIAALEWANHPLYLLADQNIALRLLRIASELDPLAVEVEDRARLARILAFANWLAKNRRNIPRLCVQLTRTGAECQAAGLANLSTWSLFSGLGCLQLGLGRYEDALGNFRTAYQISNHLGNEPKMGAGAINISICHGRLGDYLQQLTWTEKAARHLNGGGSDWMRLQGAYYRALGFCMIGENRKGLEEIEAFDSCLPADRPRWMVQASSVMVADILFAAGETERASRVATEGFQSAGPEPLGHGYAGIVARWAERTIATVEIMPILEKLCDAIEDYDLIDQAEILCARERSGRRTGTPRPGSKDLLLDRLSRLPAPVEEQLRRLGAFA